MKRREFIAGLGGAAVWPLAARALQGERVRRVGYLSSTEAPGEPQAQNRRRVMVEALARLGYIEGNTLLIERRLLSDQVERVNGAAAELLALHPDVIVAVNTPTLPLCCHSQGQFRRFSSIRPIRSRPDSSRVLLAPTPIVSDDSHPQDIVL